MVATFALSGGASGSAAPPEPQAFTLACATNDSSQLLGNALPATVDRQALVLARIIFGPDGGIGAHTHPGALVVSIESGTLGFTLLEDGMMSIMRSSEAGTPAAETMITTNQEIELTAGDWLVETGMIHSAHTIGDEPAVVLLSGLIEAGQPLTRCVDEAP